MRWIMRLLVLGALGYAAKWVYDNVVSPPAPVARTGFDTPTGTDPSAKYRGPGYEDKSFGQAVAQDQELADRLMEATGGDVEAASMTFRTVSAGAPVIERQEREGTGPDV